MGVQVLCVCSKHQAAPADRLGTRGMRKGFGQGCQADRGAVPVLKGYVNACVLVNLQSIVSVCASDLLSLPAKEEEGMGLWVLVCTHRCLQGAGLLHDPGLPSCSHSPASSSHQTAGFSFAECSQFLPSTFPGTVPSKLQACSFCFGIRVPSCGGTWNSECV